MSFLFAVASVWYYLLGILMFLTGGFLILLVLVQRGRGGGLTGALGGMGGQSAFGTKAGDVFTRVTMVTAAFWILLCIASIKILAPPRLDATQQGSSISGAGAATESDPTTENTSGQEGSSSAADAMDDGNSSGGGDVSRTLDFETPNDESDRLPSGPATGSTDTNQKNDGDGTDS